MSVQEFIIDVEPGRLRFIYDDSLACLLSLGKSEVQRASHVEPDGNGEWTADMNPVGGPVLGPFPLRGIALSEEVKWLRANYLGHAGTNRKGKKPGALRDGLRNPPKGVVAEAAMLKSPEPNLTDASEVVPVAEHQEAGLPRGTD